MLMWHILIGGCKPKGLHHVLIEFILLHFIPNIPNNILTRPFKELTKYKNDHQWHLNYIYKNYTMHLIVCL